MGTNLLKPFFFRLAIEDILLLLQTTLLVNAKDACMTNAYHFNRGRDTVKNRTLRGHVIANVTARKPLFCFDACRLECRCISFNFKQSADQHNWQLNEENSYTNFDALEFAEGWQYYDLVIDYNNIRVWVNILLLNTTLFTSLKNKKWHSFMTFNNRAIFVWPWDESARTKQKQQANGNRAIWLVYWTDTNARGFWLVKRTLGLKNVTP